MIVALALLNMEKDTLLVEVHTLAKPSVLKKDVVFIRTHHEKTIHNVYYIS